LDKEEGRGTSSAPIPRKLIDSVKRDNPAPNKQVQKLERESSIRPHFQIRAGLSLRR
jgi:hypothetical protein